MKNLVVTIAVLFSISSVAQAEVLCRPKKGTSVQVRPFACKTNEVEVVLNLPAGPQGPEGPQGPMGNPGENAVAIYASNGNKIGPLAGLGCDHLDDDIIGGASAIVNLGGLTRQLCLKEGSIVTFNSIGKELWFEGDGCNGQAFIKESEVQRINQSFPPLALTFGAIATVYYVEPGAVPGEHSGLSALTSSGCITNNFTIYDLVPVNAGPSPEHLGTIFPGPYVIY